MLKFFRLFDLVIFSFSNSTMKRNPENNISDFEESGKKLLRDVNSEAVKV